MNHPKINFDKVFLYACKNGHLNIAKHMLQIKPTIDISDAFRWACKNGHLDVAQWLLQINPTDLLVDLLPDEETPEEELERFWSLTPQQRDIFLDNYGFPKAYIFGSYPSTLNSRRYVIDAVIHDLKVHYDLPHAITSIEREKLILYSPNHAKDVIAKILKQFY
jgi:hypothetical protein